MNISTPSGVLIFYLNAKAHNSKAHKAHTHTPKIVSEERKIVL